ncbi:hypothetical protein FIBSPDRAFT_564638 [Athelia psychrophila]|uniref:Uncharacterized protein n=1 Tax=Athelia psychrophila TaxID=1759441 RepID=A0A167TBI1_9AGAM|nr:hypothetical protein FIBSPDRAFT_564638 [Fibularhizoctonia sp. CBS 109695]
MTTPLLLARVRRHHPRLLGQSRKRRSHHPHLRLIIPTAPLFYRQVLRLRPRPPCISRTLRSDGCLHRIVRHPLSRTTPTTRILLFGFAPRDMSRPGSVWRSRW